MNKGDCFYLGYIAKVHGFKGEVSIKLDVNYPEEYQNLESVFIEIDKELIPFFITRIEIRSKGFAIASIEGIDSEEKAEQLLHAHLYLPLSQLPALTGNNFYFHEIIGYQVIDQKHGNIGIIENVLDLPHQAVLEVKFKDKEILIPVNDDIILGMDRNSKTMNVSTPEGLVEIYL